MEFKNLTTSHLLKISFLSPKIVAQSPNVCNVSVAVINVSSGQQQHIAVLKTNELMSKDCPKFAFMKRLKSKFTLDDQRGPSNRLRSLFPFCGFHLTGSLQLSWVYRCKSRALRIYANKLSNVWRQHSYQ